MHYNTSDQERINLGFGGHTCNNGVHFCGLYETEDERDDIILGYLRQGLLDQAHVLYTPTERSADDFVEKFIEKYPDEKRFLENNTLLTINSADDLYYQDGEFSPMRMNINLNHFFIESQKNGKRNIRTTAEMVWALDKQLDVKQLMVYESRLNYFIPGKPWVSICMYNVARFNGQTIMKVLQTHPYTIGQGGTITKNPYYIHPDEWLEQHAPEFRQ
jgi:hypothetical protein